jgi:predicted sulfurtransferase
MDRLYIVLIMLLFNRINYALLSHKIRIYKRSFSCSKSDDYVVASFYRFTELTDERVDTIIENGKKILQNYSPIKGTLLVANEGINGQFAIPANFSESLFPGILKTIDHELFEPVTLNLGESFSTGTDSSFPLPFRKLLIRRKNKVLTDNLPQNLDWQNAGPELDPASWHEEIEKLSSASDSEEKPILLGLLKNYL